MSASLVRKTTLELLESLITLVPVFVKKNGARENITALRVVLLANTVQD